MITRRHLIRNLVISVGGGSLLSACGGRVTLDPLSPGAPPRFYSDHEMALLSRLSDLLIPRTGTPGALDMQVPALLDRLMDEWANAETKAQHRAALTGLDEALRELGPGPFVSVSDEDAESALVALDALAFDPAAPEREVLDDYRSLKGLISQMYFATEAGADEQGWVPVPGRWDPCVERT